ncbi:ketosynthase chain-length factor [Streptomyces sp. NPDC016459]|uniref:ketosynthase chain-length factor n=1 Tax=Streptomyces sp. NPDC016459 TaxID=3157190 RepID=UPI0033E8E02C
MNTDTVITGMGLLAPTGLGHDAHWKNSLEGASAIGPVTRFDAEGYPSRLAGEVADFVPEEHLPSRLLPQTDHMTRMALVASDWALADAGFDPALLPEYGVGVVTAASAGGFEFGHRELQNLWDRGPEYVSAYQSFAWFYAVNTGQVSIRHGLRGPAGALVTEQAGGLDALGQARRQLRRGQPMVLAGAVDGSPCPWGWVSQLTTRRMSRETDPALAYRPFAAEAAGYVPGEGGALFVLEGEESARARGARHRYGRMAGYATAFDPPPRSGRSPNLARAVRAALDDAELGPEEIDVVFADAAGTPEEDAVEAAALRTLFGPHGVPVTAPKTMTGRLGAGGPAVDVATALLALREGVIPPTVHVPLPLPDHTLDLVTSPRRAPLTTALILARGQGGFNSALVVTAPR